MVQALVYILALVSISGNKNRDSSAENLEMVRKSSNLFRERAIKIFHAKFLRRDFYRGKVSMEG